METSALTGECVEEVFLKLTQTVLGKVEAGIIEEESLKPPPMERPTEKKDDGGCCGKSN